MRQWNLVPDSNLSLILAADARCGPVSYPDDQIWELNFGGAEPPAISLRTTYGLRARAQRIFPRFIEGDRLVSDPAEFARPPVLRSFHPSFVRLEMAPLPDIDVTTEIWVPSSQAIAGRVQFTNQSDQARTIRVEWVATLTPNEGQRMAAEQIQATNVLCGQTENLFPVLFLTGGAQPGKGPYTSLTLDIALEPGSIQTMTWCHAALDSNRASFDLARNISALPWEAHIARIELLDAGQVEIYTGNPDWDLTFALSQSIAHSLFSGPTPFLPYHSFVLTRQPDQGYSPRGDGSDYSHLWSGQSPLDAWYLANLLLPGSANLLVDVLRNYLSIQAEDGSIDWKPGLGGQRSRLLATPLLADLAWQVYEVTQDRTFLEDIFTPLMRFVHTWLSDAHDRDQDDLPEWDHTVQTGFEEHPLFSTWLGGSLGVDIRTAESPALGSMLYRECKALLNIARLLGKEEHQSELQGLLIGLHIQVEASWDEQTSVYMYRDRDSHTSPVSEVLGVIRGAGELLVQRRFEHQARLLVRIQSNSETRPRPRLYVHGTSTSGQHRVERIDEDQVRWSINQGILTGDRPYTEIERVEIQNLLPNDEVTISTAGYYCLDQTQLLPLWAGIPANKRATVLIENTITNPEKFWREFGLPAYINEYTISESSAGIADNESAQAIYQAVNLQLNTMVGEGLVAYGYRPAAAELVSRMMEGVVEGLKRNGVMRRLIDAHDGITSGEANALSGLAPVGLFLEVLGVRILSPDRVELAGFNPFQYPVTVKYRGTTVLRQREKTVIIFPGGQTVEVTDPDPQTITLA